MEIKMVEIRDRATCIPALAIRLGPHNERERYLLARAGFGRKPEDQSRYVVLSDLGGNKSSYDPFRWDTSRTMRVAHEHIIKCWDDIASGDVVDVEYILGEASQPKISESATEQR